MLEKKKSVIVKATINTPTYHNEIIDSFSFVNFFYGNNGTGKTSFTSELVKPENLETIPGDNLDNYNIFSYNTDFIKNNFSLKDKLKAIYTLGSINIENQERITQIKKEIKENNKNIEKERAAVEASNENIKAANISFYNLLWSSSVDARNFFARYIEGFQRNKEKFANNVVNAYNNKDKVALIEDFEILKKTISSAYECDDTDYANFKYTELNLPNKDLLLQTPLTSSESTEFARFVKILGNISWIKEGHDKFHTYEGKCPYCQRPLPENFEDQYKSCFDEEYKKSINELKQFYRDYERIIDLFIKELRTNTETAMPSLDLKLYNDKIDKLETDYRYNLKLIQDKITKPDLVIKLIDLSTQITTLKGIVELNNVLIKEHKDIIANRKAIKQKCPNEAYKYLAYLLRNQIIFQKETVNKIRNEIKLHNDEITRLYNVNAIIEQESKDLGANAVSAEPVVKAINKTINHSGFQGFHLEWNESDKGSYQVVYNSKDASDNYIPATKLSEGETNFISFLYFYYMKVNTDENGSDKESIVIIDDPVSSMDNQTLFIVSSLVKNLIDRCINASTIEEPVAIQETNVAQIFILTHNVYFHANITPEYENNYESVNFYQISKNSNKSKIKLRIETKSDGTVVNINPIKNSYSALWREIEEVETSISACNIIQRILGYYFLNLCGYTNKSLENKLLTENAYRFLKDTDGNDTEDRYNLVRSFLEYLGHSQNIVGNEVYYVDGVDVQTCKETFALIFDAMGQTQHYKMMMNQK